MIDPILDFALDTAHRAGHLLRELFSQPHTIRSKSSAIDLVTEADLASDRLITEAIRQRFPDHEIVSEEGLPDRSALAQAERGLWLVDPLDGTTNYAHGYPVWGVSLAYVQEGQVVVGVAYDPLREETFWAVRGSGAWCNGERLHVSGVSSLHQALVATGFPYRRSVLADNNLREFDIVVMRVQGERLSGAAVLDLAHLAAGRLDAYWEKHLQPWDWAAGWLLVQEAGGLVTDLQGEPWSMGKQHLVASNGLVHQELLALLHAAHRGGDAADSRA